MDSEWSEWKNLEKLAKQNFVDVPEKTGVYKVRWAKNGKPMPINRFYGQDEEGILYIGEANNLKTRIEQFWEAVNEEPGKEQVHHSGGNTFSFFRFSDRINLDDLEVKWKETKNEEEAKDLEICELYSYIRKFYDRPVLNLQAARWHKEFPPRRHSKDK